MARAMISSRLVIRAAVSWLFVCLISSFPVEAVPIEQRQEAALQKLRDAVRLNPNDAKAHHLLGLALGKRGRLTQPLPSFGRR